MSELHELTPEQKATIILELRDVADKIETNEIEIVGFRSGPATIRHVGKHKPIGGFWQFELVYRPGVVQSEKVKDDKNTSTVCDRSAETTDVPPVN